MNSLHIQCPVQFPMCKSWYIFYLFNEWIKEMQACDVISCLETWVCTHTHSHQWLLWDSLSIPMCKEVAQCVGAMADLRPRAYWKDVLENWGVWESNLREGVTWRSFTLTYAPSFSSILVPDTHKDSHGSWCAGECQPMVVLTSSEWPRMFTEDIV